MKKPLLLLLITIISFAASSQTMDMISLSQFSSYTPGSNCWFTTPRTFGTEATYAGYVTAAKDGSGLVFGKGSDFFYVDSPVPEARIKQITVNFLTEGQLDFYMSDRRKQMSGGSYISASDKSNVLKVDGDYGYFVLRNSNKECIVSSIIIEWQLLNQQTVETPTLMVDGQPFDTASELDLNGTAKQITLSSDNADAKIFYMWEPDVATGMPLYNSYDGLITIETTGMLSFYAAVNNTESEVGVLKIVDSTSAIESIESDETAAPTEWFNLQGVKVENPKGGVFIQRRGNKSTKMMIRE
ncbi:MAG: hypothetical protein NC338_02685 [Firmicutes bacterium]|nr:hypothetical protein [Bacillota bacterium]MCM1400762.1 hypothetical protein [Bacteroides sp.]MCM1477609.1 hypothetical protein [Bacteroides sp.]